MNEMNVLGRLLREEKGATATEYAVMLVLILLVALVAIVFLGQEVADIFNELGSLVAPFFSGGT